MSNLGPSSTDPRILFGQYLTELFTSDMASNDFRSGNHSLNATNATRVGFLWHSLSEKGIEEEEEKKGQELP